MSDRIVREYVLTSKETALVKKRFSSHNDWEKTVFDDIKKNIINHLRTQQNNKCCYCKRELGFDIKEVDIEHIIPKSSHPQFTFHGKNLALSCPGCNTKKGYEPVAAKRFVRYPKTGTEFKIIHAHFDVYSDHILIDKGSVYIALSSKGSETITFCELFRLNTVEKNIKKYKAQQQSELATLTEAIRTGSEEEKNQFLQTIENLLKRT